MLLVLDLETTGLDPKVDKILECSAVRIQIENSEITTKEVFNRIVPYDVAELVMDDYVTTMHSKNGLLQDVTSLYNPNKPFKGLDHYLTAFALNLGAEKRKINLVGNSIHFDKSFLVESCPNFCEYLSHRMIDVSSFHLVYDSLNPIARAYSDPAHRAYDDCLSSIKQLSTYLPRFSCP